MGRPAIYRARGTSDLEPPALAPAIAVDRPVDQLRQTDRCDQLVDPCVGRRRRHAPQPGVQLQVCPAAQRPVDDGVLEHHAAHAPGEERLGRHVIAGQARAPRGGHHGGGQHPDRGGLARPVGAKQAEHLARDHFEIDLLDRLHPARVRLALAQPGDLYRRRVGHLPQPVTARQGSAPVRGPGVGQLIAIRAARACTTSGACTASPARRGSASPWSRCGRWPLRRSRSACSRARR